MDNVPIALFIVEPRALWRHALRTMLTDDPTCKIVGDSGDDTDPAALVRDSGANVAIVSIGSDYAAARALVNALRTTAPDCRLLVLGERGESQVVYEVVRSGAHGFLTTSSDPAQLLGAVRRVGRGEASLEGQALSALVELISVPRTTTTSRLTGREEEVLRQVALGRSNREIAGQLAIAESTVRSHLHAIMSKLRITNRVQAAAFALGSGAAEQQQQPALPVAPRRSRRRTSGPRERNSTSR